MTGERIRAMRWWDIPQVHDIEVECFPDDSWSIDQFENWPSSTREYLVAVDEDHAVVGYAEFVLAPDSDLQTVARSTRSTGAKDRPRTARRMRAGGQASRHRLDSL